MNVICEVIFDELSRNKNAIKVNRKLYIRTTMTHFTRAVRMNGFLFNTDTKKMVTIYNSSHHNYFLVNILLNLRLMRSWQRYALILFSIISNEHPIRCMKDMSKLKRE